LPPLGPKYVKESPTFGGHWLSDLDAWKREMEARPKTDPRSFTPEQREEGRRTRRLKARGSKQDARQRCKTCGCQAEHPDVNP
jgi:hypothetical protein